MNKMNKMWLLWASCFALLFAACDDDDINPADAGATGLILVNQGNYKPGNGTLDLYLPDSAKIQQNIYQSVNGESVDGIIESINVSDNLMMIMVNQDTGSGKVIFADANTLEMQQERKDDHVLYNPRYAAFSGNRVFVSVWGALNANYQLTNSSIAVFNRSTYELEKSIPVPVGPEGVLIDGNNLWVANSFTDTITIINTSTLEVARKFKSLNKPSKLEKGESGMIYMLAGDTISTYHPSSFALEQHIKLPGNASKWQFVGKTLYFLTQEWNADYSATYNTLYKLDLSQATKQAQQVLQMDNAQVFWVNPKNGEIYLGIAGGADPGTLLRLAADGSTELDRAAAGVFPHQFFPK